MVPTDTACTIRAPRRVFRNEPEDQRACRRGRPLPVDDMDEDVSL